VLALLATIPLIAACRREAALPDSLVFQDSSVDAPNRKVGEVSILVDKTINSTLWLAVFGTDLDLFIEDRDDGPCSIRLSRVGAGMAVSAGVLTVSGGTSATVTMPFDPANGYFSSAPGVLYVANNQLAVDATGGAVPEFGAQLAFPTTLAVTSASPTALRLSGFTATWSPTASPVVISVRQYPSGAPKLSIRCVFEGGAGTGTIPASSLTDIVLNESVGIDISTESLITVMAGEYPVDFRGVYSAVNTNSLDVQP
jgi:hypothetical protein